MPIRPELRKFYGKTWREVTRAWIIARARNRCEQCGKPNHVDVLVRQMGKRLWWRRPTAKLWRNQNGRRSHPPDMFYTGQRLVHVVLTVAHLNHTPGDDREDNLRALCQWCHLHHDLTIHVRHAAATRARRKDAARPLLAE